MNDISLPYDKIKQQAIIGHMLRNPSFFKQCIDRITPAWFNDIACSQIYKAMHGYWKKYNLAPTPEEVRCSEFIQQEPMQAQRNVWLNCIGLCEMESERFKLEVLRTELTEWMHSRMYREAVEKSTHLFNSQKYRECYQTIKRHVDEITTTTFNDDGEIRFENPTYLLDSEFQYQNALTTGLRMWDNLMHPSGNAPGGGLFRKDTTVMLAPSNVGKTTTLITMAMANVKLNKHVLFMTHEGRPDDIREKMLCSYLGISKANLFKAYKDPVKGKKFVEGAIDQISKYLTYLPYNKAGMTVEEVIPIIRRRQEILMAKTGAKGYDMIVSDYPGKLSTVMGKGMALRQIYEQVYEQYVQLALELDCHCLLAIQSNRQASKDNRAGDRLLTMEDVHESFGTMQSATNVITINRDEDAMLKDRVVFYISKSRSSKTGVAIMCRSKFSACRSHHESLESIFYHGYEPMTDRAENLLVNHKGTCVDAILSKKD
jgi:replicative DNA helicase